VWDKAEKEVFGNQEKGKEGGERSLSVKRGSLRSRRGQQAKKPAMKS